MEKHSFRIVSGESLETMQKLFFLQNLYTRKLGEIKVFYAVLLIRLNIFSSAIYIAVFRFAFKTDDKSNDEDQKLWRTLSSLRIITRYLTPSKRDVVCMSHTTRKVT